jgi:D-alanyl-D-alanine carboxypeptidase
MKMKQWLWMGALLWLVSCSKSDTPGPDPVIIPPIPHVPSDTLVMSVIDDDINAFISKHNVPGLSLAIVKDGKLVYAKGYGYGDKETSQKVTTISQFRLASLSKWITSATIMRLIDQGRLSFNEKVFGPGSVLGTDFGTSPYAGNINNITVEQLLHHTGGGWGNSSNDPMFREAQLNSDDLLSFVLDNRPLSSTPGTQLDYSNIGYFILSHIIQKITNQDYQRYVTDTILKPMGITDMTMAATSLSGRKPNEVKYYGTSPYNYGEGTIARSMGAGGWLGTTTDLMRFIVRVDGSNTVPDIISSSALALMSSRTAASGGYACGFMVSSNGNWFHGGTYNGSRNWMVKTTTGFAWAILINTTASSTAFNTDLDRLVWPAVNNPSTPWPDRDLF